MKNNSKRHSGSTLIEVIISMTLIAIISVGIYSGYLLLIRHTKEGEEKQISSLIGKQVSEDIKSASGKKNIILNGDVVKLTDNIELIKFEDNYSYIQTFDQDGKESNDINYKYKVQVNIVPKKNSSKEDVSINDAESNDSQIDIFNVFVIKNGSGKAIPIDEEGISNNIDNEITVNIKIEKDSDDDYPAYITIDRNYIKYIFRKENMQINLDLRYCTKHVKINVDNTSKKPLNLCILNNNDTDVENLYGTLNEYYRSDFKGKIGVLYDVNIEIFSKKNQDNPIFKTSFIQNIDTK